MCMRSMQWWPNSGPVDKEVAYAISFEISSRAKQIMAIIVENKKYRQTSNISCTLVGNKIVDHSDVVGASPIGAAPTTSLFST